MPKFQLSLRTKITKDGQPFFDDELAYSNMDEEDIVLMEGLLVKVLQQLNELGAAKAESKKSERGKRKD